MTTETSLLISVMVLLFLLLGAVVFLFIKYFQVRNKATDEIVRALFKTPNYGSGQKAMNRKIESDISAFVRDHVEPLGVFSESLEFVKEKPQQRMPLWLRTVTNLIAPAVVQGSQFLQREADGTLRVSAGSLLQTIASNPQIIVGIAQALGSAREKAQANLKQQKGTDNDTSGNLNKRPYQKGDSLY